MSEVQSVPDRIPTISLSKASSDSDPSIRADLLAQLRHSLLDIGFLYISDHGVDATVVNNLLALLPPLFDLPEGVKSSASLLNSPHFLGYSSFGHETTAGSQDQREQFEFANEVSVQDGDESLSTRLLGPNQWPVVDRDTGARDVETPAVSVGRLREAVEAYIREMQALSTRFLSLVEEALEVESGLLQRFTGPQDRLKVVHYRSSGSRDQSPKGSHVPSGWIQGVGPHKDSSGWMTFLLQTQPPPQAQAQAQAQEQAQPSHLTSSSSPSSNGCGTTTSSGSISGRGLQVLTKSGTWINVPPMPGTFVVNMGQAFEVVTNGLCKATTHRVLLPSGSFERYSVPFFQGVQPRLRKRDFMSLWAQFDERRHRWGDGLESDEARNVDSPFLKGKYDTWGEAQLRTKIRSHRDVGRRWYPDVYDKYVNDDN
ncbi:putative hyoscyamine 6-dioxygenase [Cladophialophora carrionii]|uniref:Putative hyoscyamine 6-dioxygenase n=1 Tax=Cladophialophora carrionii TaxID=86049 RepID=A0A1C1CV66_9EURO|nr:putative hyoscyamine 6-dioxygenase [Cladophialophora carrionii]